MLAEALVALASTGGNELGVLVAEIRAQSIGSAGRVEQHVTGIDHAQQAVQGYGVQNVTFGGQGGHLAGN